MHFSASTFLAPYCALFVDILWNLLVKNSLLTENQNSFVSLIIILKCSQCTLYTVTKSKKVGFVLSLSVSLFFQTNCELMKLFVFFLLLFFLKNKEVQFRKRGLYFECWKQRYLKYFWICWQTVSNPVIWFWFLCY